MSLGINSPKVEMLSGLDSAKFCDLNLDVCRLLKPRRTIPHPLHGTLKGLLGFGMFRKVMVPGAVRSGWPSDATRDGEPCQGGQEGWGSNEPSMRSRAMQAPAGLGGGNGFGQDGEPGPGGLARVPSHSAFLIRTPPAPLKVVR